MELMDAQTECAIRLLTRLARGDVSVVRDALVHHEAESVTRVIEYVRTANRLKRQGNYRRGQLLPPLPPRPPKTFRSTAGEFASTALTREPYVNFFGDVCVFSFRLAINPVGMLLIVAGLEARTLDLQIRWQDSITEIVAVGAETPIGTVKQNYLPAIVNEHPLLYVFTGVPNHVVAENGQQATSCVLTPHSFWVDTSESDAGSEARCMALVKWLYKQPQPPAAQSSITPNYPLDRRYAANVNGGISKWRV